MPYSTSIIKLLQNIEPGLREVLIALLEEIERQREETVTKKEFLELNRIVQELAQAQRELAEAQKRTEQRVNELAEAQKRTEQRLNELAEAQKELAEAQKRTEEELRNLIEEHRKTRSMLGSLQHTVGYSLEDKSFAALPALLKKDFGIEVIEDLKRDYIKVTHNKYMEVNILGKGRKNGKEIWIIGECKSQIKKRDVDKFINNINTLNKVLEGEKLYLIVTYQTSPPTRNYINEKGLKLYFSYQFKI